MSSNKIAFCATVTFASLAATATLASGVVPAVHLTKSEGVTLAQATSPPPAATLQEPVQSGQSGAAGPGRQGNMPEMGRRMERQGQTMRQNGTTMAPNADHAKMGMGMGMKGMDGAMKPGGK